MNDSDVRLFPTCKFLQFKPREEQVRERLALLGAYINGQDPDDTLEDREAYRQEFVGCCSRNFFLAWCSKLDQLCVITVSVAMSGGAAPILHLASGADNLQNCEDREPDEVDPRLLTGWFFDHLCLE